MPAWSGWFAVVDGGGRDGVDVIQVWCSIVHWAKGMGSLVWVFGPFEVLTTQACLLELFAYWFCYMDG